MLLGIQTALKDDLQCTTAEFVYITTLCLPGKIFTTTSNSCDDPSSYVTRLKASMSQVKPPPVRTQLQHNTYMSNYLSDCTHVFVRNDKVKKPLQPPYNGSFKVLKRDKKYFTLQFQDRTDTVSLHRLKPAHIDNSASSSSSAESTSSPVPVTSTPITRVTHSGRHVRWPKHLS